MLINTPLEFAIFIDTLFSLLVALAAWGNTLLMLYDEADKKYVQWEACKTGIRMFIVLLLFTVCLTVALAHVT